MSLSIVLANGTVRLQLDITKSSGLHFDLLLSSELLNVTKVYFENESFYDSIKFMANDHQPSREAYFRAMELLRRQPDECMMVASHAYDLRAAKDV